MTEKEIKSNRKDFEYIATPMVNLLELYLENGGYEEKMDNILNVIDSFAQCEIEGYYSKNCLRFMNVVKAIQEKNGLFKEAKDTEREMLNYKKRMLAKVGFKEVDKTSFQIFAEDAREKLVLGEDHPEMKLAISKLMNCCGINLESTTPEIEAFRRYYYNNIDTWRNNYSIEDQDGNIWIHGVLFLSLPKSFKEKLSGL